MHAPLRRLVRGTLFGGFAAAMLASFIAPAGASEVISFGRNATPVGTMDVAYNADGIVVSFDTDQDFTQSHLCVDDSPFTERIAPGKCEFSLEGPATAGSYDVPVTNYPVYLQLHVVTQGETAYANNTASSKAFYGNTMVCADGFAPTAGQCLPIVTPPAPPAPPAPPVPPVDDTPETCADNEILVVDTCTAVPTEEPGPETNPGADPECADDEILVDGKCTTPVQDDPTPPTCDEGFELDGDTCVETDPAPEGDPGTIDPTCSDDQILVDGHCVDPEPVVEDDETPPVDDTPTDDTPTDDTPVVETPSNDTPVVDDTPVVVDIGTTDEVEAAAVVNEDATEVLADVTVGTIAAPVAETASVVVAQLSAPAQPATLPRTGTDTTTLLTMLGLGLFLAGLAFETTSRRVAPARVPTA